MYTKIVSPVELPENAWPTIKNRYNLRHMSGDEWIELHGSGTLRKNKRIGFAYQGHYLHERVAYEYGFGFECHPATRVQIGIPISEGDNHAVTESGWHFERYQEMKIFPEDEFSIVYLTVTEQDNKMRSGIAIFVNQTSAKWLGERKTLFALVAEEDQDTHEFKTAINPF